MYLVILDALGAGDHFPFFSCPDKPVTGKHCTTTDSQTTDYCYQPLVVVGPIWDPVEGQALDQHNYGGPNAFGVDRCFY